jgi:leucyl/phenylalanyl-tRNA--protein transferase
VSSNRLCWLNPDDSPEQFPDVEDALSEPDGLLAAGGDLSERRLLAAYRKGIFPWFGDGQPILWWSPDPRCVIRPAELHISRRLRQQLRNSTAELRFNSAFGAVIRACAADREALEGTWITADMITAFERLHADGWAHSIEIWNDGELAGGMYGLYIGRVFFGESMFSAVPNASKTALLGLTKQTSAAELEIIDCQVVSQHLLTLGASALPRHEFIQILARACNPPKRWKNWPKTAIPVAKLVCQ